MKNIAFVLGKAKIPKTGKSAANRVDPDGYWIEVVQNESINKLVGW
jgi:hypothetical protein